MMFAAGFAQHEVLATARSHAMVAGLSDGALRTNLHTAGAKNAASQIKRDRFARRASNCFSRADGHAGVAAVGAFAGIDLESATVSIG